MIACPVCRQEAADFTELADHFGKLADASDIRHVMWLNRHVSLREMPRAALREKLEATLRP